MTCIPVKPEQMIMLEKAQYELNGLFSLVRQFTGETEFKPSKEEYSILLDKYTDKNAEVELIKQELIKEYVQDSPEGTMINFNFAYSQIEFIKCPHYVKD